MADPIVIQPNLADAVAAAMSYVGQAKALVIQAQAAVVAASTVANTILTNHNYGQFTSDPAVRPDGSAMQDGDIYYNLVLRALRMRTNGAWTTVAVSATAGALLASANLADLTDQAAARANLGVNPSAVLPAGQPNGLATLDGSGFIPAVQLNLSGNSVMIKTNNLSDLTNPSTARTNLGLGNAAVATIGTGVPSLVSGTVPIAQLPTAVALGVATLDISGHVPLTQLNAGNPNGVATLTAGGLLSPSQNPAGSPTSVAKSIDYTTVTGDSGKIIAVTAGSSTDRTITLVSAATAGDGAIMAVQKVDSGTKKVIVTGGTASAWLTNQGDIIAYRSDGSVWQPYWINITPRAETFTAGGTWTKPPLATRVFVKARGAGGGGSAGNTASGDVAGGSGGGGGSFWFGQFLASDLASTETVTIGTGGTGGTVPGGNGGVGGDTSFGTTVKILAGGGAGGTGSGGGTGGGVWGAPPAVTSSAQGRGFEGAASGSFGFDGLNAVYGGGSGASQYNTNTPRKGGSSGFGGGAGGGGGGQLTTGYQGGAGGTTGSAVVGGGGAGGSGTAAGTAGASIGVGGGGGGTVSSGTAGAGGAGGVGAGGGGGGSHSGNGTAGVGGAGGRGQVDVITYFSV